MKANHAMPSRSQIVLWMLLGGVAAGVVVLEVRRRHLIGELQAAQQEQAERSQRRIERGHATQVRAAREAAAAKLKQARLEVAVLEQRARQRRREMLAAGARGHAADMAALAAGNRDPNRGMARLEDFENKGFASPEAALETLVWAALNGREEVLARGMAVEGRARQRAGELSALLPADQQAQYTPERMAAMWFENSVLTVPAAHFLGQQVVDAGHVTVNVAGGFGGSSTLSMEIGPAGWQLVVPERGMEYMQQRLVGSSPPLPASH